MSFFNYNKGLSFFCTYSKLISRFIESFSINKKGFIKKLIIIFLFTFLPYSVFANLCGEFVFELGYYTASQGKSQHINIDGLIGDDFSLKKSTDQNFLIGLGYYFDTLNIRNSNVMWGVNAFYLAPTKVSGNVTQEDLFTNLSYQYSLTHYPIYFSTKALIKCKSCFDLTLDLGIGPNIICARNFKEHSLDGGITIPDRHLFSNKNVVSFSATAGLGWRIDHILGNFPIEINYRFFYLGQGEFKKANNQLKNTLHTGHNYANALYLSIII